MGAESGIETIGIIGLGNIVRAFARVGQQASLRAYPPGAPQAVRSVGPRSRALRRVRRLVFPSALGEQYDLR
jgi:hypothetical protein